MPVRDDDGTHTRYFYIMNIMPLATFCYICDYIELYIDEKFLLSKNHVGNETCEKNVDSFEP